MDYLGEGSVLPIPLSPESGSIEARMTQSTRFAEESSFHSLRRVAPLKPSFSTGNDVRRLYIPLSPESGSIEAKKVETGFEVRIRTFHSLRRVAPLKRKSSAR